MTNEERKEILCREIYRRFPYGNLKVQFDNEKIGKVIEPGKEQVKVLFHDEEFNVPIQQVKLVLHPLNSMTEEENEEWVDLFMKPIIDLEQYLDKEEEEQHRMAVKLYAQAHSISVLWLDEHNLDHSGLLELELAVLTPREI